MKIRVLSYNIHKGFSHANVFVLDEVRQSIVTTRADLVFLQEVVGHNALHMEEIPDWPIEPQFEFIADTVWSHSIYGKNAVYDESHHGNACLSRWPVKQWENINISKNKFENRGLLHVIIDVGDHRIQELHLLCVHLNLLERDRRKQVSDIIERIESHVPHSAPLILAGDFNDWRQTAGQQLADALKLTDVHQHLHGRAASTFPAWLPILPLDRIYTRGFEVRSAQVLSGQPWRDLSDHLALLAELEIHF